MGDTSTAAETKTAEEQGSEAENTETKETGADHKDTAEVQEKSLEDILSNPEIKAQYEASVKKAAEDAVAAASSAAKEAERINAMTDAEKADYAAERREKQLAEREKKVTIAEMKTEVVEEFRKSGIPSGLAESLNYDSKETLEATKNTVVKAFQAAVQDTVNDRLRGKGAPAAGNTPKEGTKTSADDFAAIINSQKAKR